jgi:hypothetical protein
MPGSPLSESRKWETINAPPADGDAVSVSSGTAPFRANFMEKMAARDSYLYNGPFNGFLDHVRAEVTASGTDRAWHLHSVRNVAIHRADGSINRISNGTGVVSLALTGLSASTWYYIYAWNNEGALSLEASAILPEPTLDFKDSDPTRVYLGCFRTDTAGRAIPMVQTGRDYTFRGSYTGLSGTPLALGSTLGASGFQEVSARLPPQALRVRVGYTSLYEAGASATHECGVSSEASVNVMFRHIYRAGTGIGDQTGFAELTLTSSGTIFIHSTHATEVICTAGLVGFSE